jgi:hypothetical protein
MAKLRLYQPISLRRAKTSPRDRKCLSTDHLSARPSIALAAELFDQGIELVLDNTDGPGADLHKAQPASFDEAFVKRSFADTEALQDLAFSQNSLGEH